MRASWLVLILAEIQDSLSLLREAVCHRNDSDLSATGQRSGETLPRRKRELVFPKGSAFVVSPTVSGGFVFHYAGLLREHRALLAPRISKEIDRNQLDRRFLILRDNRVLMSNHPEAGTFYIINHKVLLRIKRIKKN